MNYYGFAHPIRAFLAGRDIAYHPIKISATELDHWLKLARAHIPFKNQLAQFSLLDSHDTARFLHLLGKTSSGCDSPPPCSSPTSACPPSTTATRGALRRQRPGLPPLLPLGYHRLGSRAARPLSPPDPAAPPAPGPAPGRHPDPLRRPSQLCVLPYPCKAIRWWSPATATHGAAHHQPAPGRPPARQPLHRRLQRRQVRGGAGGGAAHHPGQLRQGTAVELGIAAIENRRSGRRFLPASPK